MKIHLHSAKKILPEATTVTLGPYATGTVFSGKLSEWSREGSRGPMLSPPNRLDVGGAGTGAQGDLYFGPGRDITIVPGAAAALGKTVYASTTSHIYVGAEGSNVSTPSSLRVNANVFPGVGLLVVDGDTRVGGDVRFLAGGVTIHCTSPPLVSPK